MRLRELFREIAEERYGKLYEDRAAWADQINPEMMEMEIPEDRLPGLRLTLIKHAEKCEQEIASGNMPATGVFRKWVQRN